MSQDKIDKCLNLAFDKGALIGEATNAFLFARKLILNGKGKYAGQCSSDENKSERKWTITCSGLQMMYMIEETTKYAYKHNMHIRIQLHGKVRFPTANIKCKGSLSDIKMLDALITLVFDTEY